ncbi:UvrD-helicase domain-containing protein (plasmid) [Paenibacillus rhizovicinus]|uniref:DNA 3'-5' helicase n=1 Tax=Paenibacillus rhizovicinus TaxID=2704463 RepID=A0A6C0PB19_9BACL|nr:UvrD-helicase domain-containing protein [Paenibacillus rhizovicinus]QHW35774.1 UvrD-helicase domain-containing protein [Paenibacillus rhizovicinus]
MSIPANQLPQVSIEQMLMELNPQQRRAAEIIYGPVLVIAGAGSGKTKTLTYRIANMIGRHNIQAKNMFVATFTNKAAGEMKERIIKACGPDAVSDIWAGTFHSLCVRILRRFGHHLGYDPKYSIYDQDDSHRLIYKVYQMHSVEDKYHPKQAAEFIGDCKNNLADVETAMVHRVYTTQDEMMAIVYRDYQMMLKEANAMDFDDLIMNTVMLLENFEEVRNWAQNKFQYVMSDEYQDVNHAQFRLLQMLAWPQNNIFVVGDDKQSIYRFRGSDIAHIMNFEAVYFPCNTVQLTINYRSNATIVAAGNGVIKNNTRQKEMTLIANKQGGQPINDVTLENEHKEAAFVSWLIQKAVKEGKRKWSDFAILYRTNNQSAPFEQLFLHNMIPHKVVGGLGFFQREEIKDIVSYLRVINNPKDDAAIGRIMNKPARGIGDTSQDHLQAFALSHKVSLHRAMKMVRDIDKINKRTGTKITEFVDLIEHFQKFLDMDVLRFCQYVLDQTGYVRMWENKATPEAQEKVENIQEFLRLVERYKQEHPDKELSEFLLETSLLMDFDNPAADNSVKLMTMHSSKGLEFPVVFIVGVNEKVFPSWRSKDQEDIEEERRLAYVGITRAEEELYLTHTTQRTNFRGGMELVEPSRFLDELPEEIVRKMEIPQRN